MSLDLTDGQVKAWQELKKIPTAKLLTDYKTNPKIRAQVDELARNKDFAKWLSSQLLEHRKAIESGVTPTETVAPVESESTVDEVETTPEPAPSTDQLAAEAQRLAEVEKAKTVVAPDFTAEDAALKAVGIAVTRDAQGKVIRVVQDYQVTDAQGNAIGRPTHFESRSLAEHFAKLYDAHFNAARALHETKKLKAQFNPPKPVKLLSVEQINALAKEVVGLQDHVAVVAKITEIIDSEADVHFKALNAKEAELKKTGSQLAGLAARLEFVSRHLYDFNPCDANFKLLAQWVVERDLQFTQDNLDLALAALQDTDTLAPYTGPSQTFAKVPDNPATDASTAAVQAQPIPAAAATVAEPKPEAANTATVETKAVETKTETPAQPVAAAPAAAKVEAQPSTPAGANQPTPARRPGVDGSLQPGTLSAQRVTSKAAGLTMQEFLRMSPQEIRARKKDPKFRAQMEALGIKDVAANSRVTGEVNSARNNDAW